MTTPAPFQDGGILSQQSSHTATHPLSPTLWNVVWPEFSGLLDEFSTIVSELLDVLTGLQPAQFDKLLVYLGERLKPVFVGFLPTGEPANLPDGPTPKELVQFLQKYWNYLNTDLLEDIIRRVTEADSPLQSLMAEYKASVCSEVGHTLNECKKMNVKPLAPPGYTTMAVKVDLGVNPLSYQLHQILQFRKLLIKKFGVSDALFAGFAEGSIVLYFFIPAEAVYSLCSKLESNCATLEEQHVTTLVVFNHFSIDVSFHQMTVLDKVSVVNFIDHCIE